MLRQLLAILQTTFRAPDPFEPEIEQEFLRDYGKRFLAHRRAISILAAVYWSAYVVWDLFQALQSSEFQQRALVCGASALIRSRVSDRLCVP